VRGARRSSVRAGAVPAAARYHGFVRDLVFLALVVAFFALAVLAVRACELIVGERQLLEEEPRR
jgi:hypothetical protein